jgi:AraC-like DNA-binding protein/mannose-6-phosphate isomerase-like protein (cupin superfamily)
MKEKTLLQRVSKETAIERKRRMSKKDILDAPHTAYIKTMGDMIFKKDYFIPPNGHICINRHQRYAEYPEHTHDYIELNYVLTGKSPQLVDGEKETIKKGDIIFMNVGTKHKLYKHERGDIVINFMFSAEIFTTSWLAKIKETDNTYFQFISDIYFNRPTYKYLIFNSENNAFIQEICKNMISHYYSRSIIRDEILTMYLPILISELILNCSVKSSGEVVIKKNDNLILDILKTIDERKGAITLTDLSNIFHYNPNYLSNLIKDKIGKTFTELKNEKKAEYVKFLCENTDACVSDIFKALGILDTNHFYKFFEKRYGKTPGKCKAEACT